MDDYFDREELINQILAELEAEKALKESPPADYWSGEDLSAAVPFEEPPVIRYDVPQTVQPELAETDPYVPEEMYADYDEPEDIYSDSNEPEDIYSESPEYEEPVEDIYSDTPDIRSTSETLYVPDLDSIPEYEGQEEPTTYVEIEDSPRKKWPIILVIVLAVLLIAGVVIVALLQQKTEEKNPQVTPSVTKQTVNTTLNQNGPFTRVSAKEIMTDQVRGAYLIPGKDFMAGKENTVESVKKEIDTAVETLMQYKFNTIIVPVNPNNKALYKSTLFEASSLNIHNYDVLTVLLMAAKDHGIKVFAMVNCGVSEGLIDPTNTKNIELLDGDLKKLGKYEFDGYILDDYYYTKDTDSLVAATKEIRDEKERNAFAEKAVENLVVSAKKTLLETNPVSIVGVATQPVWAKNTTREDGLEVDNGFDMVKQGHADIKFWIIDQKIDFLLVKTHFTLDSKTLPYKTIIDWWAKLCNANNMLLYSSFADSSMGTKGWQSPDEMALQWAACNDLEGWNGGFFHSLQNLKKDWNKSTKVLLEAMDGNINLKSLAQKLTLSSPSKTNVTTDSSTFTFKGTADPHFPLIVNGKKLTMSKQGLFASDFTLQVGKNTFVFEHKGKKTTYTVYYEPELIKSVSPSETLTLPGEAEFSISAICYKDAVVTARLHGEVIPMKQAPIKQDENNGSSSTDYENFSGDVMLPVGINHKQDLGSITVTVSYNGVTKSLSGGHVYVEADEYVKEVPTTTEKTTQETTNTTAEPTYVTNADGSIIEVITAAPTTKGTTVKTAVSSKVLAKGTIMQITSDYAETFDNKVNDYSSPMRSHLPAKTLDVLKKTVYDSASGHTYYLLGNGRRVYKEDAKILNKNGSLTANSLTATSSSVGGTYTTLTLSSVWTVPYALSFNPQSYPYESKMGTFGPKYDISSFTASHINITFYYTTNVSGTFNLEGSPILSSCSWTKSTSENTCTLHLNMKKTGYFSGYSVQWSGNNLIFRFRHACKKSTNAKKPLSGMTIMIDPGHGGQYPGTGGVISGLYEKSLNLNYGLTLRSKLEALGAKVIMTRTTDVFHELDEIQAMARKEQPDLFISCHMNGHSTSSANGPSVHYYNEWSKSLAVSTYSRLRSTYLKYNSNSTLRSNLGGGIWDPFAVTRISDCPSILIEFGFMTNPSDEDLLVSNSFRSEACSAIANGVVEYQKSVQR